jgi:hypothetical protein
MKEPRMPRVDDLTSNSAEVLEPSGIHARDLGRAMKQLVAALSKEHSAASPVYGVVVHGRKHGHKNNNYLTTIHTFFAAYRRGWETLSRIPDIYLTSSDQNPLQSLEMKDYGDVRLFWGTGSSQDVEKKIKPTPGIYIVFSHLDIGLLEDLSLPLLPARFRNIPLIMQIRAEHLKIAEEVPTTAWPHSEEASDVATLADDDETAIVQDSLLWRKKFVRENECWTAAKVAEESTSRAANRAAIASRWAAEKKTFSVRFEGKQCFPRFQFQDGAPVPVVSEVIKVFPEHATGWELAYFFSTPNPNIGGRKPLDLLKSDPSRVMSLAQAFAHPADVF